LFNYFIKITAPYLGRFFVGIKWREQAGLHGEQVAVCFQQTGAKHHFRYAKVHILAFAGFNAKDSTDQPPALQGQQLCR